MSHEDLQVGALSVAGSLLAEVSLLPTTQFDQILNERFAQGLQTKLLIGASYGQCFNKCVGEEVFNASARTKRGSFTSQKTFVSRLPDMLPWVDGPGSGYDLEKAQEILGNRYDKFVRPIAKTLQRLVRESEFQTTVKQLRASGWKDWHILSAVFHVTMNYRLNNYPILLPSPEAEMAVSKRMVSQVEPEDAILVPLQEYKEEKLREQLSIYMISFAKTYGLEIHQRTPDFTAIEDFLAHRYNFWKDDIEHDDPFKS